MKTANDRKNYIDKLIYTGVAVVLLFVIVAAMVSYVYSYAEQEAYETLHYETLQIKNDINLQFASDRENLQTMARVAAQLNKEGADYGLLFESFKSIGLFESIGVLLPNNTFITKNGTFDLSGGISFEEESARGEYITGRVMSLSIPGKEVVRSAVPVTAEDGTTIAMIYGIVNLDTFKARYYENVKARQADLFVIEGASGDLLVNTKRRSIQNISELATTRFTEGFSYKALAANLQYGLNGFTSFEALTTEQKMYAHYAPMEIENWQIMLMQPEEVVFKSAKQTTQALLLIAALIFMVMMAYAVVLFVSERKHLLINRHASYIRKVLLGINRSTDGLYTALQEITYYAKARSSFVVDNHGMDYYYVTPSQRSKELSAEERAQLVSLLLMYVSKKRTTYNNELYLSKIMPGAALEKIMPELSDFLKKHALDSVWFACVANDDASVSLLGVVNPRNHRISMLLEDIAICFTMAIHNQKHLVKTEEMAHTDALTGVANRMAYKEDIRHIDKTALEDMACVFIDVNELNYYNNTYGHAAGDQMLSFISQVLSETFADGRVYRIGGDEFLVFVWNLSEEALRERLQSANDEIEEMKYHVSVGVKYGSANMTIEEIVNAAEKLMYAEKAKYYQEKESKTISSIAKRPMEAEHTGIVEIDAVMSVLAKRYFGILCVMHESNVVLPVLSPAYFSELLKSESGFKEAWTKYVHDYVQLESRRGLQYFMDYETLEKQLAGGKSPSVTYAKVDGGKVKLTVCPNAEESDAEINSVWIFEEVGEE